MNMVWRTSEGTRPSACAICSTTSASFNAQLHDYINKRYNAAHFEDRGNHPSDLRLPGLVIVTVCHRSPPRSIGDVDLIDVRWSW